MTSYVSVSLSTWNEHGYLKDFLAFCIFVVKTLKPYRHSVTICTPYCTRHYWLPGFSLQLISCLILFDRFSMEPKVSVLTQKSTICIFQDKWKSNVLTAKRKLESLQFQLHHCLSKFEVPVVVNFKHIFELFGLYTTCFLI